MAGQQQRVGEDNYGEFPPPPFSVVFPSFLCLHYLKNERYDWQSYLVSGQVVLFQQSDLLVF